MTQLFKASWLRLACVSVVIGWAASAAAQTKVYSLSGSGGYWIGDGMPIPVTKASPPNGAMKATPAATVRQTTGTDPVQMQIRPAKLTKPLGRNWVGVWANNPILFMVSTAFSMKFPALSGVGSPPAPGTVTFKVGGRTGPPTLTWCPGYPATNPPTCTPLGAGTIPGQLTYKATKAQFGGPAQAQINGKATVWVKTASSPPCKHPAFGGTQTGCIAVKGYASPAPLVAVGGPGYSNSTSPMSAVLNVYAVSANPYGTIGLKAPIGQTVFKNNATSFGGPWTTGSLSVVQSTAAGAPETFTLKGSDARVSGIGKISLVAGGVSQRVASGPNANRGWLNLQVTPRVPSLSSWGIGSLAFLLLGIGAAGRALARRKK